MVVSKAYTYKQASMRRLIIAEAADSKPSDAVICWQPAQRFAPASS